MAPHPLTSNTRGDVLTRTDDVDVDVDVDVIIIVVKSWNADSATIGTLTDFQE
ncbi:hypothetical protein EBESD8_9620 [Rhodococcus aetherivorans]|nr:hypothetical protein EBESD8_9620 [Rhodococcus aetherivorans]